MAARRDLPVLPNLTVQQLEYLVAAADASTRAAAAAGLGVSPSALTQGLAELERRVGLPLFERRGRQTLLRPDATEVLAHARRVVAATGDLARWAGARRAGTSGSVRLGAIDAVAVHHRAAAIRAFRTGHPDVDLHLTGAPSGPLLESLVRGDLDVAVLVQPAEIPSGIVAEPLLDEPLLVYAPDDAHVGASATWGPWVAFPSGSHTRSVIATALASAGARFEVVAESNQPEVLREMVRLGLGWAVLPAIQAEPGAEPLAPARPEPLAVRRLVLAQRADVPPDAAVDALAEALRTDIAAPSRATIGR
ncbi:MAG: LysR family transcriptional regulator [Actinomycetota bacterium]|nr:LysR family transcriptional regulator [Actinomycetota bacterium]